MLQVNKKTVKASIFGELNDLRICDKPHAERLGEPDVSKWISPNTNCMDRYVESRPINLGLLHRWGNSLLEAYLTESPSSEPRLETILTSGHDE